MVDRGRGNAHDGDVSSGFKSSSVGPEVLLLVSCTAALSVSIKVIQ